MKTRKKTPAATFPAYDREIHRVLNMIYRTGLTYAEVVTKMKEAGYPITVATLYNWRKGPKFGGTRYPAGWRIHAMAEVLGFPYVPVQASTDRRTNDPLASGNVFDEVTPAVPYVPKKRGK